MRIDSPKRVMVSRVVVLWFRGCFPPLVWKWRLKFRNTSGKPQKEEKFPTSPSTQI